MKIIVHTMKDCLKCAECKKLFKRCWIRAKWKRDSPALDIEYPWIEITYTYEEISNEICKGAL